ncbi:T9SS type A sorting domain-containing protein [Limnovirga soli]|uniref:T9SS type A sorting domain-containing protein n=1 Tax=Limnovirga soli TaxID=2656915 RepID=A0A8J8FFX7_9BACT|nr:T9SS type A sorting domain-containing protein [Limnovirga soli]NNV55171.1 T9SS type A sorting domain-containing protein [Limnovirga soli]
MKQQFLQLILLCSTLIWSTANATETEPNDTRAQANTLALNGSDNGAITPAGEVDWWKVTTNKDGRLDITWTSGTGSNVSAYLYDNDGVTLLTSNNTTSTGSMSKDGLAVGTYYIRMQCFYGTETGTYTLSNTLNLPAVPIDAEPNGTAAQALTFALNSTVNGHIGYYYNNQKDTFDWYKITTNVDGRLKLTMQSLNGQNVSWYLYSSNATTQLASGNTTSTGITNSDGLLAGTYYVRVNNYYTSSEFAPYTFSDSLFTPSIVSDAEPNGTRAQAKLLPLNNSRSGHIGYSDYIATRDTFDWYKVTTVADGRLRLTMQSFNGQNVSWYLYDNDGTTLLTNGNTTGTLSTNRDGLAAGTYYVRVNTYYGNEFASYTLSDSLFLPAQANDTEPNDTKAQALTFAANSTITGHTGYYYNLVRDGFDWYKLTLPSDANLQLTLTSNNGQNVSCYLYDNDGTTQLNYMNTTSTATINTDGLQAGTYFIRINNYYTSEFAPYTLTNNSQLYSNANDAEPNNAPYQAKTIPANGAVTGHINFYYNLSRDGADWYKINYTGSGALTLNVNQEPHLNGGGTHNISLYVYKDTAAGNIGYQNSSAASWSYNMAGLTQGYYWIRVQTYYGNEFASYSLGNTFTQVTKASIKVIAADTATTCTSTNAITMKCSKSQAPYTVQLFRYGIAYGSPVTITSTKNFQFKNLPQGQYFATAFGDGATGTAFGKSAVINMVPAVTTTGTTNITAASAKVNFTTITCAKFYVVQYHKAGDSAWLTKNSVGNTGIVTLNGLTANTTYNWRVQAADSVGKVVATSKFTDSVSFTTAVLFASANNDGSSSDVSAKTLGNGVDVTVYPNPVSTQFTIQYGTANSNTKLTAVLKDMMGNIVWKTNNTTASALSGTRVNTSNLPGGMYMLLITDLSNNTIITKKVIVSK